MTPRIDGAGTRPGSRLAFHTCRPHDDVSPRAPACTPRAGPIRWGRAEAGAPPRAAPRLPAIWPLPGFKFKLISSQHYYSGALSLRRLDRRLAAGCRTMKRGGEPASMEIGRRPVGGLTCWIFADALVPFGLVYGMHVVANFEQFIIYRRVHKCRDELGRISPKQLGFISGLTCSNRSIIIICLSKQLPRDSIPLRN